MESVTPRPYPRPVGNDETPDLRGLRKLWRRAKEAAAIVTACATVFAGLTGAGRLAIKWAGLATSIEMSNARAETVAVGQEVGKLTGKLTTQATALVALQKTADTTAAAVARLEKRRTKVSQPKRGADE